MSFSKYLEPSRTSTLKEHDLKDGLKILTLQDGRFWPSRLNSTPLPDIFDLKVEGQRGNRQNIMARDDILNQAVSIIFNIVSKMDDFNFEVLNEFMQRHFSLL